MLPCADRMYIQVRAGPLQTMARTFVRGMQPERDACGSAEANCILRAHSGAIFHAFMHSCLIVSLAKKMSFLNVFGKAPPPPAPVLQTNVGDVSAQLEQQIGNLEKG
jgi:hypothetical protein